MTKTMKFYVSNVICTLVALTFSTGLQFVAADLPVHCLRSQIVGDWKFTLSKPSNKRSSCGHLHPDTPAGQPSV